MSLKISQNTGIFLLWWFVLLAVTSAGLFHRFIKRGSLVGIDSTDVFCVAEIDDRGRRVIQCQTPQ